MKKHTYLSSSLIKFSISSIACFLLASCNPKPQPPVKVFTLPASQLLTTENHSADTSGGFLGLCVPSRGAGSINRINRLPKDTILVGWDRIFYPDDCDTSIVDWYRGAVLFNLNDLNHVLNGKDPISIELLFTASGYRFQHLNGETIADTNGKLMLCAQQIELATDAWPQWQSGTHNTINGDGNFIPLAEGEMQNLTQDGVHETSSGQFRIEVTNAFRNWRSGNIANFGFMFRSDHESSAQDVHANDGCLTQLTNFAIRVTIPG